MSHDYLETDEERNPFKADSWKVFRILSEFVDGFETMTNLGPSVSIFGSARFPANSPYYNMAIDIAHHICQKGFAVITGGGPGIMEAANRGALEANGLSCGLAVDLPHETGSNAFINPKFDLSFRYFFVRKVMFIRYAQGFVFLPGGFGTMDELFEAITLIQTKKIKRFPIYLMGKDYWSGMIELIKSTMVSHGCVRLEEFDLFHITDDPAEVADGIERHYQKNRVQKNF